MASEDDDCTDCEGSGICHQTERYCTCSMGRELAALPPEGAAPNGCPICGAFMHMEGAGWEHPHSDTCPLDSIYIEQGHAWMREFKRKMRGGHPTEMAVSYLRGKDLCCWCRLDQPCHADVLLELANETRGSLPETGWMIWKDMRGWYRPDAAGYTYDPSQAGRYSYADALAHSHPNGINGPRDGMSIKHESHTGGRND